MEKYCWSSLFKTMFSFSFSTFFANTLSKTLLIIIISSMRDQSLSHKQSCICLARDPKAKHTIIISHCWCTLMLISLSSFLIPLLSYSHSIIITIPFRHLSQWTWRKSYYIQLPHRWKIKNNLQIFGILYNWHQYSGIPNIISFQIYYFLSLEKVLIYY